jgi:hypothetical protein
MQQNENKERLGMNGIWQLLVFGNDFNLLDKKGTIEINTEALKMRQTLRTLSICMFGPHNIRTDNMNTAFDN